MNLECHHNSPVMLTLPEDLSRFLHHLGLHNPSITEGVLPGYMCVLKYNIHGNVYKTCKQIELQHLTRHTNCRVDLLDAGTILQ